MSDDFDDLLPPAPPVRTAAEGDALFDQAGIDALFGDLDAPPPAASGLRAVIESKELRHERMPMLEVVFERMMRTFTTSMRSLTSDAIEISLDDLTSARFGDFMNRLPLPAMIGVFSVPEWENFGLATVEPGLIYAVVDALLGGRHGNSAPRIEGRGFTTIEINLVGRMLELALADLATAFAPIAPVQFKLDRMETNPRFAAIARPTNLASVANLHIDMDGRGGTISILLPFATLEPIRPLLLQRFMGEKQGRANIWRDHLTAELALTTVTLDAVLAERAIPLRELNSLKVGQTLALGAIPDGPVSLSSGGVPLARGLAGQKSGRLAIRLETAPSAGAKA